MCMLGGGGWWLSVCVKSLVEDRYRGTERVLCVIVCVCVCKSLVKPWLGEVETAEPTMCQIL